MPNYRTIAIADITPRDTIDIQWPDGHGRGPVRVTEVTPERGIVFRCGSPEFTDRYDAAALSDATLYLVIPFALSECIEFDSGRCSGSVDEHSSRSGMTSAKRCDFHWSAHNDKLDRVSRDYPDSPIAPSWFDPTYAGETWDSEY